MATEQAGGTYMYAVVPKDQPPPAGLAEMEGVEQSHPYLITAGGLTAVVSDVPTRGELRPERRHLAAHQRVLERVTGTSKAVLPVSFGTIADDTQGVRELLERYQADLSGQIRRVEGKVEVGVRVSYTATKPSLYEYLVSSSPELRAARDALFQGGREPTRDEKIDLGKQVDEVFGALREEYAARVEKAVGSLGSSKRNPPRSESELVNLAFLIPRDKLRDFDDVVESLGGLFPDSFTVAQWGPFPPYDFVELRVKKAAAQG